MAQNGTAVPSVRKSGSLLMSSTRMSGGSRRERPPHRARAPAAAKLLRLADALDLDPVDASARRGAPAQPEQTSRTRWPAPASRRKISNRWISAPPAWGFSRSCQLTSRMFMRQSRPERAGHAVEHAVDEPGRLAAAEPVGQPHRFVDGDLGRHRALAELVNARAGGCCAPPWRSARCASSRRREPPPRRGCRRSAHHAGRQALRPVQHARLGAGEPGEAGRDLRHRRLALQLPGIEELERAGPALGLSPEHRWPGAARAASAAPERGGGRLVALVARRPAGAVRRLLHRVHREQPEADRARQCCSATSVEPARGLAGHVVEMRRLAPDHRAERHEAGVAAGLGRRRRPRTGSSNAPGHPDHIDASPRDTPASAQQASAPSSSRAVISSL